MRTWSIERLGAVAGVLFIVFTVVGDALAGSPPGTDESAIKIAHFFATNHRDVVIGAVLTSIAAPLFLLLLAALALRIRALGQAGPAVAIFAAGIAGLTLGAAADALTGTLGRIAPSADPRTVQSLYQLDGFLTARSLWFAAAAVLLTAWAAWGLLPQWYPVASLVEGVLLVLGGVALKTTGFFSPLGGMTLIAFLGLLVWTLATAWIIWTGAQIEGQAAAVAA
jgi:hypothetical protein